MSIDFSCPLCGCVMNAPQEWAGRAVLCTHCGTQLQTPGAAAMQSEPLLSIPGSSRSRKRGRPGTAKQQAEASIWAGGCIILLVVGCVALLMHVGQIGSDSPFSYFRTLQLSMFPGFYGMLALAGSVGCGIIDRLATIEGSPLSQTALAISGCLLAGLGAMILLGVR